MPTTRSDYTIVTAIVSTIISATVLNASGLTLPAASIIGTGIGVLTAFVYYFSDL